MPGIKDLIEDHRRDPDPHPRLQREIDARLDAIDEQIDNLTGAGDDALDVGDAIPQTVSLDDLSTPGTSRNASRDDHRHQWEVPDELEAIMALSGDGTVQRSESGDLAATQSPVVSGTNTAGSFRAINQEGAGVRLTAADADGVLDDIPQAVWTPEVPEVPVVPYTLEANPSGTTYFPWDLAAYGTRIFGGNAYSSTYGAYEGSVDYYDTATDSWARIAPPEAPTFNYTGFGSNVCVVGDTLYVGAYGYGHPFTSDGRIYRFNASTLAYLGALPDSGEAPGGRQLGRPGTMCGDAAAGTLFAAVSTAYAATGGIYIYQNDLYVGRFDITGGYEFGAIVEMSPDKAWIATTNKPTLGAAAELVVLSVSGTTLAEVQRIANPSASNYWGQKVRWDNDSLGFWSTGANGVPTHYRWDGAEFTLTTTPSLTGVAIVSPAPEDGKILVDRTTTVELCDAVTGAVEYTWTGKTASSGWTTIRRITSAQFVSGDGGGATAGIGIGASEIPAIPGRLDIAGDLEADRLRVTSQAGTGTRLVTAGPEGDQEAQSELTFDGTTLDIDAVVRANALVAGTDPGGSELLRVGGTAHIVGPLVLGTDPGGSEILRLGGGVRLTSTLTSTLATGTAPVSVTSTTVCPNLNASLLLGSTWAAPAAIGSTTPAAGAFTMVVVGTDPVGTEILRIGGDIRVGVTARILGRILNGDPTGKRIETEPSTGTLTFYDRGAGAYSAGLYDAASHTFRQGPVVLGTDPGGSELLRVGGDAVARQLRLYDGAAFVAGSIYSNAANGVSLAGKTGGTNDFTLLTPAGFTILRVPTGTQQVVLGTDPGGSELLRVGGGVASVGHVSVYETTNPYLILTDASGSAYVQLSSGDINLYPLPGKGITIGSNPGSSELLRVGGDIKLSGYVSFKPSTGYAIVGIAGDDVALFCGPGAETRLRAKQDGSVVIGTDPGGSELLRVGGTLRVSGAATFASSVSCTTLTASGKITTVSAVPASFADLAAVRTWLAAQFT